MYPKMGNNTYRPSGSCKRMPPKAKCDVSGMIVNHKDLRKIYEYAGRTLFWTGLLAHKDFWYPPSANMTTPPVMMDPKPVKNPRPYHIRSEYGD